MNFVEYNQYKVDYCQPGQKTTEGDVQKILLDISQSKEYQQMKDDFKNAPSPFGRFDKIPTVSWDGTFINGCITSYTGLVAVKAINAVKDPYWAKQHLEIIKKTPYIYAYYKCVDDESLVLLCRHDNTDASRHGDMCDHIVRDVENRLCLWCVSGLYSNIHISYDPDLYMNDKCDAFHYHYVPDTVRRTKPITKDKFDALAMAAPTSLQDIADEVHQYFTLYRKNSIIAAARFFAYRAKQGGFGDMESYQAFLKMLDGQRASCGSDILMQFGEVYM